MNLEYFIGKNPPPVKKRLEIEPFTGEINKRMILLIKNLIKVMK